MDAWIHQIELFPLVTDSEGMFQLSESLNDSHRQRDNRKRILNRAKTKSFRMSVAIIAAFVICWTPYYCMSIIFMFLDPGERVTECFYNYKPILRSKAML